jgi:hypothetical protein
MDDWFAAANLNSALAGPGQELPVMNGDLRASDLLVCAALGDWWDHGR